MKAITRFFLAYLDREAAEQRMNEASADAINEILALKADGGRLPINDEYGIELALIPKYNLKGRRGPIARLWRAWQASLVRLQKQVSKTTSTLRTLGEQYASENEAYEPEWTAVLKIINLNKESDKRKEAKEN